MGSCLVEVFEDETLVDKIRRRLPYLFQIYWKAVNTQETLYSTKHLSRLTNSSLRGTHWGTPT